MPFLAQLPFSWRDVLDILAVACLFYYTISFVRGTRAVAALSGLMVLLVVYTLAQLLGLFTLGWLLEKVFGSLVLIIVVLFHEDIRQALSRFSVRALFKRRRTMREAQIQMLASTALELAKKHIGAIIVLEKQMPLGDFMSKGVKLDAEVSHDLLFTIFFPNTALHDGAVIIDKNGRIAAAGCVLPLAAVERQHFGTRHRAALGMSENSDAVVVVVSEETGIISMAKNGVLIRRLDRQNLFNLLQEELVPPEEKESKKALFWRGKHEKKKD